jgi:hypothetical protein
VPAINPGGTSRLEAEPQARGDGLVEQVAGPEIIRAEVMTQAQ